MLKCWEEQPTDRPTFETLRKTIKKMERNHKVRRRLLETIHFIGEEKKAILLQSIFESLKLIGSFDFVVKTYDMANQTNAVS